MVIDNPEKSIPPKMIPKMGDKMLFTRELTILEKAPPTITPTAKSKTFPLLINSLNSLIIITTSSLVKDTTFRR